MTEAIRKNFASDNIAPVCPEVMHALNRVNHGSAAAYGQDEETAALEEQFRAAFEHDAWVFPVTTGTAANSLALSALVPPYGAVLCDQSAHIATDEGGAPEFFTHGAKLIGIPSNDGRMNPEDILAAIHLNREGGIQSSPLRALSVTQATEWGTVYTLPHLRAVTQLAREHGLAVHLDGARLGNAVAHLDCSLADITWRSGVDVLCFGGTKNGAMGAEAVVFFRKDLAEDFIRRIKRGGHLWSKQRYVSAQLRALLTNDLWLKHATQANAMAQRLVHGFQRHAGSNLPFETHGNEVFVVLPEPVVAGLEQAGYHFYRWATPPGVKGVLIRLVTSYATEAEDVDGLLAAL
ncbi:threonine aldolase family protein [Kozakia baliensis]|uniref:threonine aldolase family protein n=1 Tax=Kozakia baliensis TaxID=153496 RepID=UPI00049609DB|nr:low specificity L-threonine aldolase [Kozakia baliensis]